MDIDITFTFPNGTSADPVVSNSTSEIDTVEGTESSISWKPVSGDGSDLAALGLQIDDVKFYSTNDTAKVTPLTIGFLQYPGVKGSDGSFTFRFNSTDVPNEVDLSYTLYFTDTALNGRDDSWDPTIKVKPRAGTAPPPQENEAGAGG